RGPDTRVRLVLHRHRRRRQLLARREMPSSLRDGGVVRVGVRRDVPVPRAPPAARAAISGNRVALLVAGLPDSDALPIRRLRDIEVWTMTGSMLGQIRAKGPVRALAISSSAVGVLTPGEVDVYSHDGREIAAIRVPPGTAASLALAGLRPIYRVGRSIYVG